MLINDINLFSCNIFLKGFILSFFYWRAITAQISSIFDRCKPNHNLQPNSPLTISSNGRYKPGSACLYNIKAPIGYEIFMDCQINLDYNIATRRCTSEYFYVSTDGDVGLRGSEYACGPVTIRRTSLFNQLVIAYISNSDSRNPNAAAGSFTCTIRAQKQACDCGWNFSVN